MENAAVLAQNLALEHELASLLGAFEQARVEVAVLKGFPLLRRLGLSVGARKLADNDLLVRSADAPRAVRLLERLGYQDLAGYSLELSIATNFQHVMARRTRRGVLFVELHWHALSPFHFEVPEALLWEHVEGIELRGARLLVLDPGFTLLQCAAHFVQHFLNEPRILEVLGSAWTRWRSEVDIELLVELAQRTGTLAALEYGLDSAAALGFTSNPLAMRSVRASALKRLLPAGSLLEPRPRPDYERQLLSWLLLDPRKAGTQLIRAVLPPVRAVRGYAHDVSRFGLAKEYVARPARAISRWASQRRAATRGR